MKTKEEIQKAINMIKNDDRYKAPCATVQINAPLALVQVELEAKVSTLEWVLKN